MSVVVGGGGEVSWMAVAFLVLLHVWHSSDAVSNAESLVWLPLSLVSQGVLSVPQINLEGGPLEDGVWLPTWDSSDQINFHD